MPCWLRGWESELIRLSYFIVDNRVKQLHTATKFCGSCGDGWSPQRQGLDGKLTDLKVFQTEVVYPCPGSFFNFRYFKSGIIRCQTHYISLSLYSEDLAGRRSVPRCIFTQSGHVSAPCQPLVCQGSNRSSHGCVPRSYFGTL